MLVSTRALVATDGVRFRTISGAAAEAIYEKPDRQTSLASPNNLEKLPSLQLITFLYEYTTTPFTQRPCRSTRAGAPPMSQHPPA